MQWGDFATILYGSIPTVSQTWRKYDTGNDLPGFQRIHHLSNERPLSRRRRHSDPLRP